MKATNTMKNFKEFTDTEKVKMYLDYVNNFLTVKRFAEYYSISEKTANKIINENRNK